MAKQEITITPRERELLERIKFLEEQNNALQDRLDMIWSILEPDYEVPVEQDGIDDKGDEGGGLVQIQGAK